MGRGLGAQERKLLERARREGLTQRRPPSRVPARPTPPHPTWTGPRRRCTDLSRNHGVPRLRLILVTGELYPQRFKALNTVKIYLRSSAVIKQQFLVIHMMFVKKRNCLTGAHTSLHNREIRIYNFMHQWIHSPDRTRHRAPVRWSRSWRPRRFRTNGILDLTPPCRVVRYASDTVHLLGRPACRSGQGTFRRHRGR